MTYKTVANASKMTQQLNMYQIMTKRFKHILIGHTSLKVGDIDIQSLYDLLGTNTITKTVLTDWVNHSKPIGLYERIIYENGKWSYIGGQDYVSEMRYLKHRIRKGL